MALLQARLREAGEKLSALPGRAAEAGAGRLRAGADVDAAATLLVGACHDLAIHRAMHGDASPVDSRLPQRLVDTLLAGLQPPGAV